jgi:hypothetical protein
LPGQAEQDRGERQAKADDAELCRAEAEDRRPHGPEQSGAHFEADEEQQDDDAEFGEAHDIGLIADEVQGEGTDRGTGDEIAEDGAEARPLGDRHRDDARGEIDERLDQNGVGVHGRAAAMASSSRRP